MSTAEAEQRGSTPRVRRGLVLAGGGAKGAYQFGCLKAFRERQIEFDYVSGTSVGALNAVLAATGRFNGLLR
jgi:predicted acylesterase/phospholipase RssA